MVDDSFGDSGEAMLGFMAQSKLIPIFTVYLNTFVWKKNWFSCNKSAK